ncbi:Monofunctional riboflavin biosynthesis protein RIBA 3, chloroplastic [Sesamum angolense]|uniref:Monofunctional riboflavin biosynthesis protein RIBA 3, chloroplastic n=1 Tax=Sesamum angolense TaxID=2727404 RepID=A0AAE1XCE6_9LAMI|nr:Monofunctional riboflavin biosynthesis protein RIBA 3, chloroplastic [Sesamum angolense]
MFLSEFSTSPRKTGNRPWKFTTCWAVGSSGSISEEESFTKENLNGSLFDALSDESSSPAPFGTLEAEITQETIDFFVSDAEGDPDCPSPGYSSIEQALMALRQQRKPCDGSVTRESKGYCVHVKHGSGAKVGTSTGVSASDRAKTVLALSSPQSRPEDFRRPGHVFPLKYRNGGVLRRVGHTEASVDLVTLAGLRPVSVLSSVVDTEDVSMASLAELKKLASDHRRNWNGQDVLVRVHSECLTGDIFGSRRCDCGNQLDLAMQLIDQAGRGVVVYLRGTKGVELALDTNFRHIICKTKAMIQWKQILSSVLLLMHANTGLEPRYYMTLEFTLCA